MSNINLVLGLINNATSNLNTTNFSKGVIDADINLTANSDTVLPTQKAVKSYINNSIAGITGGLKYKGVLDASNLGTQLNNSKKGDLYKVSVGGTILTSLVLSVGDMVIINKDVVTPTINDLDIIDNTENINNPISIDASVDILALPSGYYVFDGVITTAKGHPGTSSVSSHSTIMIFGKESNKIIVYIGSNWGSGVFFVRVQSSSTSWGGWYTYYSYNTMASNRNVTESPVYYWLNNGKQIYSKLLSGTTPTNGSTLIVTPTTGIASRLVSYDGWITKKGTNQRVPLNSLIANATDLSNASPIYQDATTGSIYLYMNNDNYNGQSFELSVYYTK